MARGFSGLHPNTISAVSVIFALLAGVAFVFSDQSLIEDRFNPGHYFYIMLAIGSICVFLNGLFDAVDGHVARLTKRSSKRGDLFDHALDRYADIFILGGIMLSPYCDTSLGALAIIAVLLTSYMGTQAQALGCGRDYSGILGRADRLVILIIAPLLQMGVNYYSTSAQLPLPGILRLTILEWTMIWFIIAGNVTAIHRGIHSWRELRDLEKPQKTLDQYYSMIEIQKNKSKSRRKKLDRVKTKHTLKDRKYKAKPTRKIKTILPKQKRKPIKLKTKGKGTKTKANAISKKAKTKARPLKLKAKRKKTKLKIKAKPIKTK